MGFLSADNVTACLPARAEFLEIFPRYRRRTLSVIDPDFTLRYVTLRFDRNWTLDISTVIFLTWSKRSREHFFHWTDGGVTVDEGGELSSFRLSSGCRVPVLCSTNAAHRKFSDFNQRQHLHLLSCRSEALCRAMIHWLRKP